MPARIVRVRRRVARALPAVLLTLAIAAYGALLYSAHGAAKRDDTSASYVQSFGSSATKRKHALSEPEQGALALGNTVNGSSSAQWHFRFVATSARGGSTVTNEEIFVTGSDLTLYRQSSSAKIYLDGRRIASLKPLRTNGAQDGPFPVANATLRAIDAPPGNELGFRFDVPARGACVAKNCTLRIDLVRATWTIRRVGVLYSTRGTATTLWAANGATAIAICIAATALAALSHAVLSLRPRPAYGAPDTEWKTT